jgi:dynein heavy chain
MLTLQVINAYNEFTQSLDIFKKVKYDILDLKAMQFEQDFLKFNDKVDELDKRVATILCQAFDDCSCLASIFRLLEIFANSLSRPAVQKLFESKYYSLIELFNQDLDEVRDIFLTHRNSPPLHPNMPPVTGAVSWTYELRQRIFKTMEQFELINHPSMNSDEAKFMKLKYQEIHGMLEAFEQAAFNKWSSEIIDESEANLAKPLLVRDESNLLRVNFDPKVVALLKEIKYFEALQIKVPEKAKNVYTKGDLLRNYVLSLDHIVKQYNAFHTGLLPVEVPLVADKLSAIDKLIEKVNLCVFRSPAHN